MTREGFQRFVRALIGGLLRLFAPFVATGTEFVPESGAVILCGNHESLTDPIAVLCSVKRWVGFMAKKELFDFKPLGALLRAMDMFPVARGASDLNAVRKALTVLKNGEVFGIFPQGKRVHKGGGDFHTGVGMIALRSGAPVVPIYIDGRTRIFHKTRLTFGPPVDLSAFAEHVNSASIAAATAQIQAAVYALKPDVM